MTYPTDDSHFFLFPLRSICEVVNQGALSRKWVAFFSIIWPRDVIGYQSGGREWIFRDGSVKSKSGNGLYIFSLKLGGQ
jgi:hypothetical protein